MSAAAPWSVKGIDPKAREVAKDLARRSGMTLGEWLNSMIMEGDDEDGIVPLPRRAHVADTYERRSRSRRLDDAYGLGGDDPVQRLSATVEMMAERLEAAERRSTIAIQGVDQAVAGLVRRLDAQDGRDNGVVRRIDDIAEELREGHRRLRRFEQETGPSTAEGFAKTETAIGALSSRLYDIEERQRIGTHELRQRLDAVEKTAEANRGVEILEHVGRRLDAAQAQTGEALRGLERAFSELDRRLGLTEARAEVRGRGVDPAERFDGRLEKLAEALTRQVEASRTEMLHRLDTAQSENRMERMERAVAALGDQVRQAERGSAQAVEVMGREVLRIAQNLNGRVQKMEIDSPARMDRLERDLEIKTQGVERRLVASEDRHALALEKLGTEIGRISDRLSERIAESERRSTQALDEIGQKLTDSSSRIEQHYDRASGELAERMRQSEERTARLLAEARESMARRGEPEAPKPEPVAEPEPVAAPADWRAGAFGVAAMADDPIWSSDPLDGPADPFPTGGVTASAPEPAATVPAPEPVDEPHTPRFAAPRAASAPFGSPAAANPAPVARAPQDFGGADVSDVLAATAPDDDEFSGETDFVDPRTLRAAAAAGRASSSTRGAVEAARAAMTAPEPEPTRSAFGLKRGGKSRLQERMDRQASRDGSTMKKALGASAVAVTLMGGLYAFTELTGQAMPWTPAGASDPAAGTALVALATGAAPLSAEAVAQATDLYERALTAIEEDDPAGLDLLTQSAELGYGPAQLMLAGLFETGEAGAPVDMGQSLDWTRRSAESGYPRGMFAYGMRLFEGADGTPDRPMGLDWIQRAARAGLVDAQFNAAVIHERGEGGMPVNNIEAYAWYRVAARSGDEQAASSVTRVGALLSEAERVRAEDMAQDYLPGSLPDAS
ncbi:SEL1-like repeat protein [Brevundimonas halotolerans]|uniref:Localization factor PodJL n=1 Tax=Brevundimonas halotolerans TaxID=69670 RepID=A0A7W9A3T4_9CAUL|nr:SEL1-like repeat protein [Brevundimonas halotolerans]MBB5660798.1 localization factor PodJL [Brevundimonas halotolerans]